MTPDQFRAAFPAFKDATDDAINAAIASSAAYFNVCRWGALYAEGLGCYVAHVLCMNHSDKSITEANDVVTHSTEKQSTTRSNDLLKMQANDWFMRTVYGQRFRRLNTLANMGAVVV